MGGAIVPNLSPVTDHRYWLMTGGLLALALLARGSLHPVSPAVVYTLLSNVQEDSGLSAILNVSLSFI